MRQTSLAAYKAISDNGLLTKSRMVVYKLLFESGPLTAGEIFEKGRQIGIGHLIVKGSICARLTELSRQGVVQEVGVKVWDKTGHTNILWDVTANLPNTLEKKKTKDQMIKELKEEIENLKHRLANVQATYPNQLSFL